MRRLGTLDSEPRATRFHDYMLARGMPTRVEPEEDAWAVWIVEEDHVDAARDELTAYRENPDQPRFVEGARSAEHVRQEQRKAEKEARRRNRDVGRRWAAQARRGTMVTNWLVALSVLVVVISLDLRDPLRGMFRFNLREPVLQELMIADPLGMAGVSFDLGEVLSGEVWRLVTPIFLHFNVLHILFNMMWLRQLGGAIEMRHGHLALLGLVLLCAVPSNVAQFYVGGPTFGGMSGVVFGLFGYIWMKSRFDPGSGFHMPPNLVFWVMAWFLICFTGAVGPIANTAHSVGLGIGALVGWAPSRLRKRR